MRKKELLNQNMSLFEQLKKTEVEVARLTDELNKAYKKIELLSQKDLCDNCNDDANLLPESGILSRESIECVSNDATLDNVSEYGAEVIGKIVVAAANCSNELTAGGNSSHRELVNLILGRTEVAKSEILSIVISDDDFATKKSAIDDIYEQATEYFHSVMGQIC